MKRKNNKYLMLLALLLLLTVGYALISTTLKINGDAIVKKQTWDVYWANPEVSSGSVSTALPDITEDQGNPVNTKVVWTVDLALPGDYYEFTVDAVNNGSIDAMITVIEPTVTPALPTNPEYIKYSVTYADGVEPAVNHLLAKNTTEKYKVRVYYDETVATRDTINNMTGDTTYTFNLGVTYGQATDQAIDLYGWTLPEGKTANTLTLGDEICTRDQCFNFLKYDGNDVVMLAKWNLKVGYIYERITNPTKIRTYNSSDENYGLQDSEVRGFMRDEQIFSGVVPFASTPYWLEFDGNNVSTKPEYTPSSEYSVYVYDPVNYKTEPDFSAACDGTTNCFQTPGYSIAYYVEQYKTILTSKYGRNIKSARLFTYEEAKDPSIIECRGAPYTNCLTTTDNEFIINTTFWLGDAYVNSFSVWYIGSGNNFSANGIDAEYFMGGGLPGVRPVIVVEKTKLN